MAFSNKKRILRLVLLLLGFHVFAFGVFNVFLYGTQNSLPTKKKLHPYFRCPCPHVIAHQGASAYAPSNTLVSFELALKQGADILELDVQETKDQRMVVFHDLRLEKKTNGKGLLRNKTWLELQKLDAGYRFQDKEGKFIFRNKKIRIPLLREVLKKFPTTRINIEIKEKEPFVGQHLLRILREFRAEERVLVTSMHVRVMDQWRNLGSNAAMGADLLESLRVLSSSFFGWDYRNPAVHALQFPHMVSSFQGFFSFSKKQNIPLHFWTVNDEKQMKSLLEKGTDGLVTDKPDLAQKVRLQWNENKK